MPAEFRRLLPTLLLALVVLPLLGWPALAGAQAAGGGGAPAAEPVAALPAAAPAPAPAPEATPAPVRVAPRAATPPPSPPPGLAASASGTAPAGAAPPAPAVIPPTLRAWSGWVLRDQPDAACARAHDDAGTDPAGRPCAWPGKLVVTSLPEGFSFGLRGSLEREGWLPLPGDNTLWPQEVTANGRPAPVLLHDDHPAVFLPAGDWQVAGRAPWPLGGRPQALTLPPATGVVVYVADGQVRPAARDAEGHLWLNRTASPAPPAGGLPPDAEAPLKLSVFRRYDDDIPARLTTLLLIEASGTPQRLTLPGVLPPGFRLQGLVSDLPAQALPGNTVALDIRPGTWKVRLNAVAPVPPSALVLPRLATPWPRTETISFHAEPQLRLAELAGGAATDPRQTRMPDDWRADPAFTADGGARLTINARQRGIGTPPPDALTLTREAWLDVSGDGFTVLDHLRGKLLGRHQRLDATAPLAPGRLVIDDVDYPLTRATPNGPIGVEARRSELNLTAESRLPRQLSLPVSGWQADFDAVDMTLHLPPGWLLVTAPGADRVQGGWLEHWTLLDLFLVVLAAGAVWRLCGPAAGGLALAALVLGWHQPGAPGWLWLNLILAVALLAALPLGLRARHARLAQGLRLWRGVSLVLVGLALLPFAVAQLRAVLHPQLEPGVFSDQPVTEVAAVAVPAPTSTAAPGDGDTAEAKTATADATEAPPPPAVAPPPKAEATPVERAPLPSPVAPAVAPAPEAGRSADSLARGRASTARLAPDVIVPTGPGLPDWHWRDIRLQWSGPIAPGQSYPLWLLPPWVVALLRLVLLALLGLLWWVLARVPPAGPEDAPRPAVPIFPRRPGATTGFGAYLPDVRLGRLDLDPRAWWRGWRASAPAPVALPVPPLAPGPAPVPAPVGTPNAPPSATLVALVLLAGLGAGLPRPAHADTPPAAPATDAPDAPSVALLDQLRERLLGAPACAPDCAEITRLGLEVRGDSFTARLTVSAAAPVFLPLPAPVVAGNDAPASWQPVRADVGGDPGRTRRDDQGRLLARVPAGVSEVVVEGSLAGLPSLTLPLPLRPRAVSASLSGWRLDGLDANGLPGDALVLVRTGPAGATPTAPSAAGEPIATSLGAPVLHVRRTVRLDNTDASVETTVSRNPEDPASSPVLVLVPLLPGEFPLTPGIAAGRNLARVTLAPGVAETSWTSRLALRPETTFRAVANDGLFEEWRFDIGPRWRPEFSTELPPVALTENGRYLPRWRPWPGEMLTLKLSRPETVDGPTVTVDRVALKTTPGPRETRTVATFSLRVSQGGAYDLGLPTGWLPVSLSLDGLALNPRLDNGRVALLLTPGTHAVVLEARSPRGVELATTTPAFTMPGPTVNAYLSLALPADRWVLATWGPVFGPAVLFWPLLLVMAGALVLIGRQLATPLKTRDWILLAVGLANLPAALAAVVVAWLAALSWRARWGAELDAAEAALPGGAAARSGGGPFNLVQVGLVLLTVAALGILFGAVADGLLGQPDMRIDTRALHLPEGVSPSAFGLDWYQDRTHDALATAGALSLSIWFYRALMLAWALWLAWHLLAWLRWGWDAFSRGGLWRASAPPPPGAAPYSPVAALADRLTGDAPPRRPVPPSAPTPPTSPTSPTSPAPPTLPSGP